MNPTNTLSPSVTLTPAALTPDLAARIEAVLAQFRPTLNFDGGDVRLSDYDDGCAELTMLGACIECPISVLTMTIGVKRILLKEVPEVTSVRAIFADGTPVPTMQEYMRQSQGQNAAQA